MIVDLIDSIENRLLRAFIWRVINVFTSVILPAIIPLIYLELQKPDNIGSISCLFQSEFLNMMLYVSVVALVGSVIAGLDKVRREVKKEEEIN
jgi:hypothetical protein